MEPLLSSVRLNNGVSMPRLGLGVYQTPPGELTQNAVLHALKVGYRHIDTAAAYRNESDIGIALRKSGVSRKEVFITTKLWTRDHGYDSALRACDQSLKALGIEQIDLFLIHWPGSSVRWESWKALERIYADGKARAIGVSNYLERHLQEIFDRFQVTPAVNQVEFSPFLFQRDLLGFCKNHKVQLEAYSPLTQGQKLTHPKIISLGKKYMRTPAQILLRWAIQHEIVVIPKSVKPERIEENSLVFDFGLQDDDMNTLNSLNENFRACWDPTSVR